MICYLNQIIFTIIDVVGWKVSFVRFCIYSIIPCILLASIIIFILFMNTKKKMNGILLASIWIASQLIVAVFCFIIYFIAISVDVPHFAEDFIKEISRLSVPTFNNPFAYSIFFIGPLTSFMNIILLIANIPLIVVNKLQNKEKKS